MKKVRIMSVQYKQEKIDSVETFLKRVEAWVEKAGEYNCDFILFPEYFSLQPLSRFEPALDEREAMEEASQFQVELSRAFSSMAVQHKVNVIAGSHPVKRQGHFENISFIYHRNGKISEQSKIHCTPDEKAVWKIKQTNKLAAIETDCGKIGVLICYDSEFPELSRILTDDGAKILFVPYLTVEQNGHYRVHYSCHARAIENQIYVVTAGNTGFLPNVVNMDFCYSQNTIMTPCDHLFPPGGIKKQAQANLEQMIFADLDLDLIDEVRANGTVKNFNDRRSDLYRVDYQK